jgi:hypothetical protein
LLVWAFPLTCLPALGLFTQTRELKWNGHKRIGEIKP